MAHSIKGNTVNDRKSRLWPVSGYLEDRFGGGQNPPGKAVGFAGLREGFPVAQITREKNERALRDREGTFPIGEAASSGKEKTHFRMRVEMVPHRHRGVERVAFGKLPGSSFPRAKKGILINP